MGSIVRKTLQSKSFYRFNTMKGDMNMPKGMYKKKGKKRKMQNQIVAVKRGAWSHNL